MGTWHLSESCAASPASPTEPKRRDYEAVGDRYRFQVLADGLVRYEWAPDGRFEDRPSAFAARRDRAGCSDFSVETTEDGWLEITTSRLRLTYECGCEFSAHGLFALVFGHTRSLWRYGEADDDDDDDANLGGTARTLDGVDGRAGWGTGVASRRGYASVDDSGSMLLTSDGFVAPRMPGAGRVDGYLFAYGHDYPAAVAALYLVSGAPPVLPRWALGNWWSRYHAYSAASYSALMGEFEAHGVPLSVAVLDMDWHLTAESDRRVAEAGQTGWTGYTWDRGLFPDPPGFLAGLRARGLRVALNEHPADGVHSYEERYTEFARVVGRDPASGEPVAFDMTSRRYARAYFNVLLRPLGCDFWWVDWQQGRHSRLRGVDPLWVLNHLHTADSARRQKQKQKQRRPLILSRYAGPGSHRHPVGFSGDAVASWASLRFQPAFTATAANVGYGWWSHDVGGHMGGGRDDERTARWVQFGCFSPVLRLHSTRSGWVAKQPWRLRGVDGGGGGGGSGGGAREAATAFLRLRHRLLPFLHSMNVRASREGVPLVRPLYWEHAERDEAYAYENSYLFGDGLVVMPIAEPADAELGLARTKGWLPPGTWVDFFQGTLYGGDREVWVSRPLALYPVFARAGAIVPMDGAAVPRNGAANPVALEVVIFVGADGAFDLHEEPEEEEEEHLVVVRGGGGPDGDDDDDDPSPLAQIPEPRLDLITTLIRFSQAEGRVDIQQRPRSPLAPGRRTRTWKLVFPGWRAAGACCVVYLPNDPAATAALRFEMVEDRRGGGLVIHEVSLGAHLVVELDGGREPRFARASPRDKIWSVLDAAQIEYALKEAVWAALGGDDGDEPSRVEMVARLGAVDMSERLRVAVMELLVADEGAGPV